MSSSKNIDIKKNSFLNKSNSEFIEQMYLKFIKKDPTLPESWKDYFKDLDEESNLVIKEINGPSWQRRKKINDNEIFKNFKNENTSKEEIKFSENTEKSGKDSVRAVTLIRAYRTQGNLLAKLDPLGLKTSEYIDELHPEYHGFKKGDYDHKIFLDGILNRDYGTVREILKFLRKTYCGTIGYEFMHISNPKERKWFRDRIEKDENALKFTKKGKQAILSRLIYAEGFEKFLHTKYIGTKRFGLDGGESLIPALEQIIKVVGQNKVKEVKIGMSHRGRLNVLANLLQKSYKRIFNEFTGEIDASSEESAGDVKYHLGASSNREFNGNSVHISLTDNPSHLEAVSPVVLGQTRAKKYFHQDY